MAKTKNKLSTRRKIKKRLVTSRTEALRQLKYQKKKNQCLVMQYQTVVENGYVLPYSGQVRTNNQAKLLLDACGVDTSMTGYSRDYSKKQFSLLKEETGTEILHELDKAEVVKQYELLKKKKINLDTKHISLSDAIRTLDDKKSRTNRALGKSYGRARNGSWPHTGLAYRIAKLNSAQDGVLRYFRYHGNDLDPRHCKDFFHSDINIVQMSSNKKGDLN